jgi:putative acetyltransferase
MLSLVAKKKGKIVGRIALSPFKICSADDGWCYIKPVSVHPEIQPHGIGSKFINRDLEHLRRSEARGFVLTGNLNFFKKS